MWAMVQFPFHGFCTTWMTAYTTAVLLYWRFRLDTAKLCTKHCLISCLDSIFWLNTCSGSAPSCIENLLNFDNIQLYVIERYQCQWWPFHQGVNALIKIHYQHNLIRYNIKYITMSSCNCNISTLCQSDHRHRTDKWFWTVWSLIWPYG